MILERISSYHWSKVWVTLHLRGQHIWGGGTRLQENASNEPQYKKTGLWGFRPGLTQTRLYSHTKFRFRKDKLALSVEQKQRRSYTADLHLVFAYPDSWFSVAVAH